MHRIKTLVYIILIMAFITACIKPYTPELKPGNTFKYVVTGQVTDQEGYQLINISKSTSVSNPKYIPVLGCELTISDDQGNEYQSEESGEGNYRVWIDQSGLVPGYSYKLRIITPEGDQLESDYDQMSEGPQIDSVYYFREDILTNDPDNPRKGIRFYVDLNASESDSRFFRWDIVETWEYHADFAKEWYYNGNFNHIVPPDSSDYTCWMTSRSPYIFTLSTLNNSTNSYRKFPLNFVDNKTTRLEYLYSMLISQYSLSEAAYTYWDQMRKNNDEQGGLYQQQPVIIKGNIHNITQADQDVLGFFSAASLRTKRIFVKDVPDLVIDAIDNCQGPQLLGRFGWVVYDPSRYPVYYIDDHGIPKTLANVCVDCKLFGGVTVKPEFWPN